MHTDIRTRFRWNFALAAMLAAGSLHADPLIYEPFAQATGTLNGKAAGTGLSGNWVVQGGGTMTITPGNLTWGSIPVSGNYLTSSNSNYYYAYALTGTTASNTLLNAGRLANGATLWFSALVYSYGAAVNGNESRSYLTLGTGPSDGFDRVQTSTSGGNNGYGVGIKLTNGSVKAHSWINTGNQDGGLAALPNPYGVNLIVGKIVWAASTGTSASISIYLPGADLALPASAVSTVSANVVADQTLFNVISFAGGAISPMPQIDEIRWGATYQDVIGGNHAYWDLNGSVAGAGGATPSGTWNATNLYWNSAGDGTGSGSIAAWSSGQTAVFAAGTDATGT